MTAGELFPQGRKSTMENAPETGEPRLSIALASTAAPLWPHRSSASFPQRIHRLVAGLIHDGPQKNQKIFANALAVFRRYA
ncbi:hypothetical protein LJR235_002792 [Pararhizobium sp. LjRoot235]|uniref:hypothetical protein n=1 Tax=Pararhizobium sp. LjRoot235 TaxID=3342291 RepID=UPI003ECDC037